MRTRTLKHHSNVITKVVNLEFLHEGSPYQWYILVIKFPNNSFGNSFDNGENKQGSSESSQAKEG